MTSNSLPLGIPLAELPGLPPEVLSQFAARGIQTTAQLLTAAPTVQKRQQLARSLNLRDQVIGKWYAMADLAQVPSVGQRYCGLLLHCGIHATTQLAIADPGRLHRQVLRFQVSLLRQKKHCPQLVDVMQWIQQAKALIARNNKR